MSAALAMAATIGVGGCASSQQSPHSAVSTTANTVASQAESCGSLNLLDEPKLPDQHVRCVLSINDLTLEVSSDPAWSFSLQNHGTPIQQFREPTEEIGETGVAPLLQDIDNSGTPVLLVVTGRGGSGGEPMAVWRLTGSPTGSCAPASCSASAASTGQPKGSSATTPTPARPREP